MNPIAFAAAIVAVFVVACSDNVSAPAPEPPSVPATSAPWICRIIATTERGNVLLGEAVQAHRRGAQADAKSLAQTVYSEVSHEMSAGPLVTDIINPLVVLGWSDAASDELALAAEISPELPLTGGPNVGLDALWPELQATIERARDLTRTNGADLTCD
jgi:hypothetical protein